MKSVKNSGFSALSQSFAMLGEDVRSGKAPLLKSRKKNQKKKTNKPKATVEPDGVYVPVISENHSEDSGGWIPVISKKMKLKENGVLDGTASSVSDNGPQKQNSLPEAPPKPNMSSSARKKKRNTGAKKIEQSLKPETNANQTSKDEVVTFTEASSMTQSHPVQQRFSKAKVSAPAEALANFSLPTASSTNHQLVQQPALKTTEVESSARSLNEIICYYTRHLEFMLAEQVGSEGVSKARSSYPSLKFSLPPPSEPQTVPGFSSASSKTDVISKTEVAFLKADLLARESEVKVLMETLKRFQDQCSLPSAPPLIVLEEKKPELEKLVKKPKIASKHIQCDISAFSEAQPVINHQQEQKPTSLLPSPPTPPAPSANELTLIKSLQNEIASLSRENAILTHRCNNANSRLEVGNQKYSKLQSETKQMTAKAAKEAEARVRQEIEALVKKLQDEVAEKAAQVVSKSSRIESLENELADSQSKVNQLVNAEQISEARVAECEKMMSELRAQNDKLTKEKEAFDKNAEEIDFLNQSLAEKEAEIAKIREDYNRLKNDLEKSISELTASKQTVADLRTNELALKTAELEKDEALAEVKHLKEECSRLKDDLEKSKSELTASKQNAADLTTNESVLKVVEASKAEALAEVEHLKRECSRLTDDLEKSNAELAASKQAVDYSMANKSVLRAAEEEKDIALAEVERLKGLLSAARKELSLKELGLDAVRETQADTEPASTEAEVAKVNETQWKHSDGKGGSEASESACSHCMELAEELSYLRSTLSKADQDLRKLQKSLDCEEGTSRAENGDANGCLENGGRGQEADL